MTTLTIEIPEKVEKTLSDLIGQLGGKIVATKKQSKVIKKKQILDDLEESINWVKSHQEGKIQAKSIEQILKEL